MFSVGFLEEGKKKPQTSDVVFSFLVVDRYL